MPAPSAVMIHCEAVVPPPDTFLSNFRPPVLRVLVISQVTLSPLVTVTLEPLCPGYWVEAPSALQTHADLVKLVPGSGFSLSA